MATTTAADGSYIFEDLDTDVYFIVFQDPDGLTVSPADQGGNDELDSDVTNFVFYPDGSTTDLFQIVVGQENDFSFDAGYYECIPIGERVWYDVTEDDIFDSFENGINGLTVNIYRQMPPIGLVQTVPNILGGASITNPGESTIDSDLTNNFGPGTTTAFSVSVGDEICNIGAGFYPMAMVGNRVWIDENDNNIQDSNEANAPGVLVEAFTADGTKVGESVTNELGIYNIDYLEKRDYYLRFNPPSGYGFATADIYYWTHFYEPRSRNRKCRCRTKVRCVASRMVVDYSGMERRSQ